LAEILHDAPAIAEDAAPPAPAQLQVTAMSVATLSLNVPVPLAIEQVAPAGWATTTTS
jgi:hypothetical protein